MPKPAVVMTGYRETMRALNRADKDTRRDVQRVLEDEARPVAEEIKRRLTRFEGVSLATIRPRALAKGVVVRQHARKRTGKRGDFGGVQMVEGFIPGAWDHIDETTRAVERALDRLTARDF